MFESTQPMKQRLAVRLVLSHLLVILVVSGIASVVLLTQSRRYFVNADRRALLVQAQVAAKNCDEVCLEAGVGTFNVSNAQIPPAAVITQNRSNGDGNLSVSQALPTDSPLAPGSPRGTSEPEESQPQPQPQPGAGQSRIQASLANDVRILRPGDRGVDPVGVLALAGRSSSGTVRRNVVAAAPILRAGKVVGAVEVRSDLRNVEGVLGDLRRRILVAVAGSALLATLIGFWRARSIAKPLRELTVAARAVADGNFAQPLPTAKGRDELAVLTTTFGDMRDRVQHELGVRNAFVADASHELRTPLTAIRGAVEILQDGGAQRPEVRDRFLQSLGNETNRLLGLVDGLLQLETNGQGFALDQNVELCALSYDVVQQMQPLAESKSIAFLHEVTEESPNRWNVSVRGNEAKLRQVLVNLLDNAITYSPPSTSVRIVLGVDELSARITIDIHDQGAGIPEADRERVFERFVRLDHSRNRIEQNQMQQSQVQHNQVRPDQTAANLGNFIKPGGAGLGLAIARSIVVAHGGSLTFRTGPNNVGTTAHVELPLATPQIGESQRPT
jgi:signal transduction histidine kinase